MGDKSIKDYLNEYLTPKTTQSTSKEQRDLVVWELTSIYQKIVSSAHKNTELRASKEFVSLKDVLFKIMQEISGSKKPSKSQISKLLKISEMVKFKSKLGKTTLSNEEANQLSNDLKSFVDGMLKANDIS
jgi:hypothetical protein